MSKEWKYENSVLADREYQQRDRNNKKEGSLGGAVVWRLPLAQGAILETRDRIPFSSAYVSASLSFSLCDYNK